MIVLFDARDLIAIIENVYGRTSIDDQKGLFRHGFRYPFSEMVRYEDGSPILDVLKPMDIVNDDYDVIIDATSIWNGMIHRTPYLPIVAAKVAEEILYIIMYHRSNYKELFFNDPLSISDYPLIPYQIYGSCILSSIASVLENQYGVDEDKFETFSLFFNRELSTDKYKIFDNDEIFEIDSNPNIFTLNNKGHPYEVRYSLGFIK